MLTTIHKLLSKAEVGEFRAKLAAGPWVDGSVSAGSLARAVKANEQLDESSALAIELGNAVLRKLGRHPRFIAASLAKKIYPPRFNRYRDGGHYGEHIDSAVLAVPGSSLNVRSDLSATLFLCEPDEYDGGELQFDSGFGQQTIKLGAGDLILYPSTTLHQVRAVTRGERIACFFWVESLVGDGGARALLVELDECIQALTAKLSARDPEVLRLTGLYHNLLRRWAIS